MTDTSTPQVDHPIDGEAAESAAPIDDQVAPPGAGAADGDEADEGDGLGEEEAASAVVDEFDGDEAEDDEADEEEAASAVVDDFVGDEADEEEAISGVVDEFDGAEDEDDEADEEEAAGEVVDEFDGDEAEDDEADEDEAAGEVVDELDGAEDEDDETDETDGPDSGDEVAAKAAESDAELFRQSEIAADYVEGLLDILDYDGDIDELVSAGRPVVEVVGGRLQPLVGQRGATLEALQELTRLAVFRQTGGPSRLLLDVGGYRANRRKELGAVARNAVEKVKEYGEPVRLEAMSAFERKCVHDVINALDGVESESEGVEPNRRIVVRPVD